MKLNTAIVGVVGVAVVVVAGIALGVSPSGSAATTAPPTNTEPPSITGTAQEGQKLVGHRGQWSGAPTDYNDFWMRCDQDGGSCSNISGAHDRTGYLLKAVDVGNTIRFKVEAKNADGSRFRSSVPTAVVTAATKTPAPSATGCPAGSGSLAVSTVSAPARLNIDQTQIQPSTVTFGTRSITLRFHISACSGQSVQGALVYATPVPYGQFAIANEQPTGSDGWASIDLRASAGYPVSSKQQLLVVFVRARKPGENLLAGISSRRLVSFHVSRG